MTVDAELQSEIEGIFAKVLMPKETEEHEMHGGAVVIDVPTGQVRALVSYPLYDPNQFVEQYPKLRNDDVNKPLFNRATQLAVEPGSTVKPIVGIGAVTQGLVTVDEGIECTGYLKINGHTIESYARCWTVAAATRAGVPALAAHHQVPSDHPHPSGFLTFPEALERSCNVYFETLGLRLGAEGLSYWFRQFGLGRRTGVGIAEEPGWVPDTFDINDRASFFSAIGQGQIAATPLQMANVAATIARDGIWLRPKIVLGDLPPREGDEKIPNRVDLMLPPAALAAAKLGMFRVVNGDAGSGKTLHDPDIRVSGKTGTAQAQPPRPIMYDQSHRPVRDETGHIRHIQLQLSTPANRNTKTPWYRTNGNSEKDLSHAWFMGFAPSDNPQIAFAVLLEYGGSGGTDAGIVARKVLAACRQHRYLVPPQN